MSEQWQPPPELRLAAAYGGLDWAQAALVRTIEHLQMVDRPGLDPLADELVGTVRRLQALQRLVRAAWLEERGQG